MKNYLRMATLLPVFAVLLLTATAFSYEPGRYYEYQPYFMERAELDRSVSFEQKSRELTDPGKIYAKPPYIFINERYKGVHVIDNSNPEDPEQIGFIVAPGCVDMAVKGDIMYLDNAVDLVAFDLTQKKVTERIRNIFPEHRAPNGDSYYGYRDRDMILVGWRTANNN